MLTETEEQLGYLAHQSRMNALIEAEELNIIKVLGLAPYPDGNQWCVLLGKDLQNGVSGFGETPMLAVYDFNKNFRSQKLNTPNN